MTAKTPAKIPKRATERVAKRATPRIPRPPTLVDYAATHATVQAARRALVEAEAREMDMLDAMVTSGKYRMAEVANHVGQGRQGLAARLERHRARKARMIDGDMPATWKGWLGQ